MVTQQQAKEIAVAQAALARHDISQSQYDMWYANEIGRQQAATPSSPMGPQPGSANYIAQQGPNGNLYVQQGYQVVNKETQGNQTTYTIAPVPNVNQPNPNSVLGSNLRQGYIPPAKTIFGTEPVINTPEKLRTAFTVTVAAVTPAIGPAIAAEAGIAGITTGGVIANEIVGAGIGTGIRAITGQPITPQSVLESAAISGPLSILGQGANQVLGLTGQGIFQAGLTRAALIQTGGRAAVSAGIGAGLSGGQEYLETQRVTPENLAMGAGLGAGLSIAGEAGSALLNRTKTSVQSRAANRLTESYETHARMVEDYLNSTNYDMGLKLEEYSLEYGEPLPGAWTPTRTERLIMSLTGARPRTPASGIVSFGGPVEQINPVTQKPELIKGFTWQQEQVVSGGFDMAFGPNTSGLMVTKPYYTPTKTLESKLELNFGLGNKLINFNEAKREPNTFTVEEPTPKEEGLPESFLEHEYHEPLSFNNVPNKFEYAPGKYQRFAWSGPFYEMPTEPQEGMSPLWNSVGSKPETSGYKPTTQPIKPVSQTVLDLMSSRVYGGAISSFNSAIPATSTQQTTNPFLQYGGRSYYPRTITAEEQESINVTYPNVLTHPATITAPVSQQRTEPRIDQAQIGLQNVGLVNRQEQNLDSLPTQIIEQRPEQIIAPVQIVNPISDTQQEQALRQEQFWVRTTAHIDNRPETKLTAPFPNFGSVAIPELSGNRSDNKNLFGLYSVKRSYPIKTASEFLNVETPNKPQKPKSEFTAYRAMKLGAKQGIGEFKVTAELKHFHPRTKKKKGEAFF